MKKLTKRTIKKLLGMEETKAYIKEQLTDDYEYDLMQNFNNGKEIKKETLLNDVDCYGAYCIEQTNEHTIEFCITADYSYRLVF